MENNLPPKNERPACVFTGIISDDNVPLGYCSPDEEPEEWVHPSVKETGEVDYCRCCGDECLHRVENLDPNGLCDEHEGEFDRDEDEQKDFDDFLEYMTKDL